MEHFIPTEGLHDHRGNSCTKGASYTYSGAPLFLNMQPFVSLLFYIYLSLPLAITFVGPRKSRLFRICLKFQGCAE